MSDNKHVTAIRNETRALLTILADRWSRDSKDRIRLQLDAIDRHVNALAARLAEAEARVGRLRGFIDHVEKNLPLVHWRKAHDEWLHPGDPGDPGDPEAEARAADLRGKLLDPELAHDIASEMFLHGYDGDLANADTVPPIAIGVVMGHLFGECHTCAEGEVRKRLKADGDLDGQEDVE